MIGTYNVGTYYSINVKTPLELWNFGATNSITYIFNSVNRLVLNGEEIELSSDIVEVELGGIRVSATIKIPVFKIHYNSTEIFDLMDVADELPYNSAYFVGKYNSSVTIGTPDTTAMPFTYLYQQSDFMFSLELYTMKCEKHVVDKSSSLFDKLELFGQLTEECDILNPSILLQYDDTTPLFMYNYVFIPLYWRYYFITSIVSVRKGLWRIGLHVDVLYSYETDINKQSGLFVRSGVASSEHSYLVDTMIPVCDIPYIYLESVPFSYDDTDVRDLNYDVVPQYLYNTSQHSVIVNVIEKTPTAVTDTGVSALATGLPNLYRDNFSNRIIQSYVMKPTDISGLLDFVRNDDTLATYIASVIAMPFLLPTSDLVGTTENVYLNDVNTNYSGYRLRSNISTYLRIAKFDFDDYLPVTPDYDFLKYEPYYQCEIYIAYHGWEKIPMIDLLGGTIDIYYVMDYIAGNSQVVIYNETTQRVVFSAPAYVGVKMGITTTNQREIETQKGNNAVSLALSLTGSAVSTFIGVATENPIGIIGGVMGATTSIASYLNKDAMLFDRASAQFSDGNTGLLAPQNIQLRFSVRNMLLGDNLDSDTILHNKVGYPNHTYGDLADFSGWCQIEEIHYTPSTQTWITSPEIEEIESLAKNGIIL